MEDCAYEDPEPVALVGIDRHMLLNYTPLCLRWRRTEVAVESNTVFQVVHREVVVDAVAAALDYTGRLAIVCVEILHKNCWPHERIYSA